MKEFMTNSTSKTLEIEFNECYENIIIVKRPESEWVKREGKFYDWENYELGDCVSE